LSLEKPFIGNGWRVFRSIGYLPLFGGIEPPWVGFICKRLVVLL
jgi:hypothetical protein